MALTNVEKKQLDSLLQKYFEEQNEMDIKDYVVENGFSNNYQTISSSLKRINKQFSYEDKKYHFFGKEELENCVVNIHRFIDTLRLDAPFKNHNILTFAVRCTRGFIDKNNVFIETVKTYRTEILTYNFITKEFLFACGVDPIQVITDDEECEKCLSLLQYEWLFNYVPNFKAVYHLGKGLEENGFNLEKQPKTLLYVVNTLKDNCEHMYDEKYRGIGYAIKSLDSNKLTSNEKRFLLSMIHEASWFPMFTKFNLTVKDILKMIQLDIINGHFSADTNIYKFLDEIRYTSYSVEYEIDTNKGFVENRKLFESVANKAYYDAMAKQLQQLNEINHKIFTVSDIDYTVIIPQTINDLIDEGKQQHNCVGHYYNDKICKGADYIYFIRKADDDKHSFITCRYNTLKKATVEHRIINNQTTPSKFHDIINKIDALITPIVCN